MRDQGQNLGRHATGFRVSDEDGRVLGFRADIHDPKLLCRQRVVDHEHRKERDAEALDGRIAHDDSVVDVHDPAGPHGQPAPPLLETPIRSTAIGEDDSAVLHQIRGRSRRPVPLQILGGRDQHAFAGREALDDQIAARQRTVPDDRVETVRGADETVVEIERQFDARVLLEERIERGAKMQRSKTDRRSNPQRSRQFAPTLGDFRGRIIHFAQDALRPFVECNAVFRERKPARRAVHERHALAALQLGQTLARNRF